MRRLDRLVVLATIALTISATNTRLLAEDKKPLPPGVTACHFNALANDHTREGLNIRAEPRADAAILGRLRMIDNIYHESISAEVRVIGVRNGWFLIEDAHYGDYDLPKKLPPIYSGRGWVSGRLLTTSLQSPRLKAAPDVKSADVVAVDDDIAVSAFLDCRGNWFLIEAPSPTNSDNVNPKPQADGPRAILRGWTPRSCTNQRTTCDTGTILEPPEAE